ncbi:aminopeptidase N [Saccharothrix saharensis]|uniref:Aminopeptidase N n=1 Tax=Saccharothrix saharensis TaxID=571190 RepID=A0A543JE84_9PSEU|nr:M1 family aminopeptidase [Saccharothrix saharensis]TQM81165.1 aminopeptidase N [Saccharothrix saharensis]
MLSYDLAWRLDPAAPRVRGRTTIHFEGGRTGVDLEADEVLEASLNGGPVRWDEPLDGPNVLRVEALFPFRDRGFRRVVDPVDGQVYLYATNFPDTPRRTMCGFGDSWQRAPFALTVTVPPAWRCLSNGPAVVDAGEVRTFAPTAPIPRATVTAVAGPFVEVHDSVHVPRSRAHVDGTAIADLVKASIAFFETLLGPFPYPKCDAVFVHDLSSLALSTPGLILFDHTVLDRLTDPVRAMTVVSHEVAHTWSGNLVSTTQPLIEGLAVYLSRLFVEHVLGHPWDPDPSTPFPDHPYAPYLARIRAVESTIGRDALLRSLHEIMTTNPHRHLSESAFTAYWSEG